MASRTVTGNIKDLTDGAVASGTVTFEKIVTITTGTTIHQFGTTTDTTDVNGDFSIDLAVPASGSYRYKMTLPNNDMFYFSIASGASVNVATLIVAETIEDSDAIVEALAAYVPLSGNATLTGPISFSGTNHAGIKLLSLTTVQRDALTPANGMVIYNSTTATGQVYQGGAWADVGGGSGALDDLSDVVITSVADNEVLAYDSGGNWINQTAAEAGLATSSDLSTHESDTTNIHGIADTSLLLDTSDLGVTVQSYSAKTAAIAALTWAANSIILLTGTATASVQALASHVVTFLQSASAADARSAIGAGTGDVTGPGSSTDNTIARFDLTTGKIIQGGTNAPTYDDSGNVIVVVGNSYYLGAGANARVYLSGGNVIIDALNQKLLLTAGNIEHGTTANVLDIGREGGREIKATVAAGYRFTQRYTLSSGTAQAVIANGTYDVAGVCRVEYALSATGVKKTGAIDDLQPSGSSNLYDDGGTNTVVVAVAADGSLSIQRTAGSLTYTIVLSILFV